MTRAAALGVAAAPARLPLGTGLGVLAWAAAVAAALALSTAGAPRVLLLLMLAPLLEEAAFRAGLQEWLLRRAWSPLASNAATALAFATAHAGLQGRWEGLLVAGPALVVGLAYARWRRLRWCVLLHAAMNAVWLAAPLAGWA